MYVCMYIGPRPRPTNREAGVYVDFETGKKVQNCREVESKNHKILLSYLACK